MNANARKVHRILVGFGVACAVAATLPCVAEDKPAGVDTVTVEGKVIPAPVAAKKKSNSAPAEENIGLFSGLAIGAVAGGPIGAVAGAITGALLGEHYHKQKVANHELAADLSGSNAERAKLTQTLLQMGGSLDHARELTVNIPFKTGDANLTPDDIDQLTTLGQLASSMDGVKIQVSGHADPRGSSQFNILLSKDRAESVAAVLTNAGLSADRIMIEALGADGDSAGGNLDEYAFQRRVSVKLIGTEPAVSTVAQAE
ncbi:MAG TPA: OmpA family protein [Steroidobacteraceae bacterium]|jgi:outer membrane protein OmpA-like peptidoglycan-associated protein